MEQRRFPPPPPRPQIHLSEETMQEEPAQQAKNPKKVNLRVILLIAGAVVAFIGAAVCGYFLFG